jgi:hypothetical protein
MRQDVLDRERLATKVANKLVFVKDLDNNLGRVLEKRVVGGGHECLGRLLLLLLWDTEGFASATILLIGMLKGKLKARCAE